jgi:ComF family protein
MGHMPDEDKQKLLFRLTSLFLSCLNSLLEGVLPSRCLSCRKALSKTNRFCADCWKALDFIGEPCCIFCGSPFDIPINAKTSCGSCLLKPPAFDECRSVVIYNDASKRLILQFKHADRLEGVPLFAALLERIAQPYVLRADLIIPVPLHWTRLWRRQYNQAALLARALGQRAHIPVASCILKRHRRTASQGILTAKQREKNMKGAFSVTKGGNSRLKGKKVILIDDVYTTGATLNACANALKKAGTKEVIVLTLARALKGR